MLPPCVAGISSWSTGHALPVALVKGGNSNCLVSLVHWRPQAHLVAWGVLTRSCALTIGWSSGDSLWPPPSPPSSQPQPFLLGIGGRMRGGALLCFLWQCVRCAVLACPACAGCNRACASQHVLLLAPVAILGASALLELCRGICSHQTLWPEVHLVRGVLQAPQFCSAIRSPSIGTACLLVG